MFPTKIADNNWSGLFNKVNALLALLLDFFDKFFSLILLAAIMPVSEPEKNPLIINSLIIYYVVYEGVGIYLVSGAIAAPEGRGGTGGSTVGPRSAGGAPLHPYISF